MTALSGSESVEEAYGLAKLLRQGLGAHNAVLPEEPCEAGGSPLSALRDAKTDRRPLATCPSSSARRSSTCG